MWVDSFLDYLKIERGYSPRTIQVYHDDLKAFKAFYEESDLVLTWETIESDVVRNWMVSMMDAGRMATTVNRRLSSLRTFYKYLLKRNLIKKDPLCGVRGPKKQKPLPVFLRENEMNRLLDGSYFDNDFAGNRDKLIINVFYATGIRLSELTGLDDKDVDLDECVLKVTGKRNKQRIVPFGEELRIAFSDYLNEKTALGLTDNGAMFVDANGIRLKNAKVRDIVRSYLGQVSTLKKRTPHVLRHTFATSMLNHHADLESLRELLGHESISTTEVYTHTTFEELKEMYNHAHPRAYKRE